VGEDPGHPAVFPQLDPFQKQTGAVGRIDNTVVHNPQPAFKSLSQIRFQGVKTRGVQNLDRDIVIQIIPGLAVDRLHLLFIGRNPYGSAGNVL
jgi:hypothetical protein